MKLKIFNTLSCMFSQYEMFKSDCVKIQSYTELIGGTQVERDTFTRIDE